METRNAKRARVQHERTVAQTKNISQPIWWKVILFLAEFSDDWNAIFNLCHDMRRIITLLFDLRFEKSVKETKQFAIGSHNFMFLRRMCSTLELNKGRLTKLRAAVDTGFRLEISNGLRPKYYDQSTFGWIMGIAYFLDLYFRVEEVDVINNRFLVPVLTPDEVNLFFLNEESHIASFKLTVRDATHHPLALLSYEREAWNATINTLLLRWPLLKHFVIEVSPLQTNLLLFQQRFAFHGNVASWLRTFIHMSNAGAYPGTKLTATTPEFREFEKKPFRVCFEKRSDV